MLDCQLSELRTVTINVTVEDSTGNARVERRGSLRGLLNASSGEWTHNSLAFGPSSVPITISVGVSGGSDPLQYQYSDLPQGCVSANSSTCLTCTPTAPALPGRSASPSGITPPGGADSGAINLDIHPLPTLLVPGECIDDSARPLASWPVANRSPELRHSPTDTSGSPPGYVRARNVPPLNCTPTTADTYGVEVGRPPTLQGSTPRPISP